MLEKFGHYLKSRRFGVKTLSGVAMSLFFAGLLVSSGLNWTAPAGAEHPVAAVQAGTGAGDSRRGAAIDSSPVICRNGRTSTPGVRMSTQK